MYIIYTLGVFLSLCSSEKKNPLQIIIDINNCIFYNYEDNLHTDKINRQNFFI